MNFEDFWDMFLDECGFCFSPSVGMRKEDARAAWDRVISESCWKHISTKPTEPTFVAATSDGYVAIVDTCSGENGDVYLDGHEELPVKYWMNIPKLPSED